MTITSAPAIAKLCVDYSRSKGFHPTTFETVPIKVACIYREIDELVEACDAWAFRPNSTVASLAVGYELADVAGYAFVVLSDLGETHWVGIRQSLHEAMPAYRFVPPDALVRPLRRYTGKVLEEWKIGNHFGVNNALEHVISVCLVLCENLFEGMTLDELIGENLKVKASREMLHGGKNPNS